MNGLGTCLLRRLDDPVGTKIAVSGGGATDMHRFIRHGDMRGAGIGIGIDSDGGDAHFPGRAYDPAGDFATIGNQDLIEHGIGPRRNAAVQSGRLSCLRAGFSSCLSASMASARAMRRREFRGMMMSSR